MNRLSYLWLGLFLLVAGSFVLSQGLESYAKWQIKTRFTADMRDALKDASTRDRALGGPIFTLTVDGLTITAAGAGAADKLAGPLDYLARGSEGMATFNLGYLLLGALLTVIGLLTLLITLVRAFIQRFGFRVTVEAVPRHVERGT